MPSGSAILVVLLLVLPGYLLLKGLKTPRAADGTELIIQSVGAGVLANGLFVALLRLGAGPSAASNLANGLLTFSAALLAGRPLLGGSIGGFIVYAGLVSLVAYLVGLIGRLLSPIAGVIVDRLPSPFSAVSALVRRRFRM